MSKIDLEIILTPATKVAIPCYHCELWPDDDSSCDICEGKRVRHVELEDWVGELAASVSRQLLRGV